MSAPPQASPAVEFNVLGPLRVVAGDDEIPIPSRRQRSLLVLLALSVGRAVSADRLIEELWDGSPPARAPITLRSYISNLRQALGGRDGLGGILATRGQGYALDVPAEAIDAVRMRQQAEEGRRHLRAGQPEHALAAFDSAVRTWSGAPLSEIADHQAVQGTLTQLTETYLGAEEGRFEALLALGRHRDALPDLEAFAADHPLREQPRALLMLALYRDGRAAQALEVHRAFRAHLNDELGIDPTARLDQLTQQILAQDPVLDPVLDSAADALASARLADVNDVSPNPDPHVTEGTAPNAPHRRAELPLVGRDREVTGLRQHLDDLTRGTGSLVLVAGEPGIGKSALLEALEADARRRQIPVHRGLTPSASGAPAFWPWTQVVDSIAAALDDASLARACTGAAAAVAQISTTIAERTGFATPIIGDHAHTLRFRLYEAISGFLRTATPGQPMVVTLDDLHAADLPSLELLSYLTPTLAHHPVMIVAAYRNLPADQTPGLAATLATVSREEGVTELTVGGLTLADVAELMDELLGEPEDQAARADVAALLHGRTGGNPFFVRQLAALLTDQCADPIGAAARTVPPGVRHVIASRLAGAPPQAGTLLAAGAVLGREFDVRTVAAMVETPVDEAYDALDEASRHGLIEPVPDGLEHRFVHALVREAVLQQLPAGRQARLHAAAAAELGRHPTTVAPGVLAEHLWQGRAIVGAAALPAQLAAADASAAVFAHEQVELQLRRALDLVRTFGSPDPATELEILLRLYGLIATDRGWGDEGAEEVLHRATQLLDTGSYNDRTALSWWGLFFFLIDRDDSAAYVAVARRLHQAIQDADDGDEDEDEAGVATVTGSAARGAVHLMSIFSHLADDDRHGAQAHLHRAHALITAAPASEVAAFPENLLVMLYLIEGYWAALSGDTGAHRAAAEMAIALADADGRPFPRAVARTLAGASAAYLGDQQFGREVAAPALDLDRRFGYGWLMTVAACVDAWAHDGHGDPAEAARMIQSELDKMLAADRHGNESLLSLMAADLYSQSGHPSLARITLERAREVPGPYQGPMVDVIDRRLGALG